MAVQKHVFKLSQINNYFKDEMKLVTKGENAVESGHVINMKYNDTTKVIHGTVHASMKDRIYTVEIFLDEDRNIVSTTCTCPNGKLSCHHVAALAIFAHYNISSTDVACSWSAPKLNKAAERIKSIPELCPPTRHYKASQRLVTNTEVEALRERLGSYGGAVGFTWLLAPKLTAEEQSIIENVGEIIFSSEFQNGMNKNYFEEKMFVPTEKVIEVFKKTVGQSKNPLWLVTKKLRLTASLFGMVLGACKRNRYPDSLYKKLTGSYNLDGVKAVEWGREHERDAIAAFSAAKGLPVIPAGLWLHSCGYLGASPDGLIGEEALIEIKCPFKYRDVNLIEALTKEKKYICSFDVQNQKFVINEEHDYFHQIQGQLHILNKQKCYLVLWTPQVVAIIEVEKQKHWVLNIDVLKNFYINKFLPYIVASDVRKE